MLRTTQWYRERSQYVKRIYMKSLTIGITKTHWLISWVSSLGEWQYHPPGPDFSALTFQDVWHPGLYWLDRSSWSPSQENENVSWHHKYPLEGRITSQIKTRNLDGEQRRKSKFSTRPRQWDWDQRRVWGWQSLIPRVSSCLSSSVWLS